MAGYCLKIESVRDGEEIETVKMVDLRDFIVNNRVPISDISVIFANEIQRLLYKYYRLGFKATEIKVQEKYASLKIASRSGCIVEYRLWILRTEFFN